MVKVASWVLLEGQFRKSEASLLAASGSNSFDTHQGMVPRWLLAMLCLSCLRCCRRGGGWLLLPRVRSLFLGICQHPRDKAVEMVQNPLSEHPNLVPLPTCRCILRKSMS